MLINKKLCEIHGTDKVVNYLITERIPILGGWGMDFLLTSVIRFHCKYILKEILNTIGITSFQLLFTNNLILEDLLRYGQYNVLYYLSKLDNNLLKNNISIYTNLLQLNF